MSSPSCANIGETRRGWIGVRIQGVTPDIAEGLGLPSTSGALVAEVTPGGPAAKGGLKNGDLITGFDGKPVPDSRTLPRIVADTPVGKTVTVDVLRDHKKVALRLVLGRLKEDNAALPKKAQTKPRPPRPSPRGWACRWRRSMRRCAPNINLGKDVHGVVVTDVDPESAAGSKNFRAGDVIVEVQNQPVHTPGRCDEAHRCRREGGQEGRR